MPSIEAFIRFPMNKKFSFGFMVRIIRNHCIVLDTRVVVAPESSHQVLLRTSIKFDSKHIKILYLPFFSN